jgi:hypothetical protein
MAVRGYRERPRHVLAGSAVGKLLDLAGSGVGKLLDGCPFRR